MNGRASHALLMELWRALAESFLKRLREPESVSAELLGVCRRFLRDNGQLGAPDDQARKDLEQMHSLYREKLLHALSVPNPSSALLAEVRQYAAQQAYVADKAVGVNTPDEAAITVPFPTTTQ